MSSFLIAAASDCEGLLPLVRVIVKVTKVFMVVIPIALILFGTIDLGKAVIASDEKEVKAAQGRLIKRFIYAALVFFIPMLVIVVMNVVAAGSSDDSTATGGVKKSDSSSWQSCWNAAND